MPLFSCIFPLKMESCRAILFTPLNHFSLSLIYNKTFCYITVYKLVSFQNKHVLEEMSLMKQHENCFWLYEHSLLAVGCYHFSTLEGLCSFSTLCSISWTLWFFCELYAANLSCKKMLCIFSIYIMELVVNSWYLSCSFYLRYKRELSLATEKEETQKRARVQTELDWQRRCEDAERNQYQKSEALIQSLSTARDQVSVESHLLKLSTEY